MPLSQAETEAGERIATRYNERDNTPDNTLGLGRGAPRGSAGIFVAALRDLVTFGRGVVRTVQLAQSETERLAGEAQIAALLVEGGPVSSVQVGDGPVQNGAVKINLDALSAQIQQQLSEVRDAQDRVVAQAASATAYSLAFGG